MPNIHALPCIRGLMRTIPECGSSWLPSVVVKQSDDLPARKELRNFLIPLSNIYGQGLVKKLTCTSSMLFFEYTLSKGQLPDRDVDRKLDISHEETSIVVDIMQRFQNQTDEEDGQEIVDNLQKVVRKLKEVRSYTIPTTHRASTRISSRIIWSSPTQRNRVESWERQMHCPWRKLRDSLHTFGIRPFGVVPQPVNTFVQPEY